MSRTFSTGAGVLAAVAGAEALSGVRAGLEWVLACRVGAGTLSRVRPGLEWVLA